jgi:hypothetical protein
MKISSFQAVNQEKLGLAIHLAERYRCNQPGKKQND